MVFYRKYRPQTIEELDSEAVKQALRNVLSIENVPHAFLFTGPKGLGKTSTARIVAKYVNCEQTEKRKGKLTKQELIPCNQCDSCIGITQGTNLDVLEIDAASNRGIDEMRDLREKIKLLPVIAKKKVYIIDEVHMLTTEAFNALLKTLEEPPQHAMFILCTTEPQKVPATILSRCFHIHFKRPTLAELVHAFERIVKAENLSVDTAGLETIASLADGSFRDGVKILEEIVIGANGKPITAGMVKNVYHTTSVEADVIALLQTFKQQDMQKGLEIVQKLVEQGTDFKYFLEQILSYLHTVLLIQVGIFEEKEKITLDLDTIKRLVEVLSKAHEEVKTAVLPQLPLELAIIEWGQRKTSDVSMQDKSASNTVIKQEEVVVAQPTTSAKRKNLDDRTFFYQLLDAVKTEHHMLAGVLRSCTIKQEDGMLSIETPSTFHQEKLSDQKALDVLEKVCEDITGIKTKILVILKR